MELPRQKDENKQDGQLAIDVFQTMESVVIKAPIAGVKPEDLDISITDEMVIIRGDRQNQHQVSSQDSLVQECYWGPFSRSYILPSQVVADKATASLKDGILTITIPKDSRSKTRTVIVEAG